VGVGEVTAAAVTQAPPDLVVAEAYGPVWQGEGPSAGRLCSFIRLGGCNLTCGWRRGPGGLTLAAGAWRCDEAFTWNPGMGMHGSLHRVTVAGLLQVAARAQLTVITGGEPLLHQDQAGWHALIAGLLIRGRDIEIETNGTLIPAPAHDRIRYNVSPKLACSGLDAADRLVPAALAWHAACPRSVFKFVVTTPADVDEAAAIAAAAGMPPGRVWIMPEGITPARILDVARQVAPAAAARGYNLTMRQQVLLYGEAGEPRD
jgi:7-carboxy-7-deazaguanine synthase